MFDPCHAPVAATFPGTGQDGNTSRGYVGKWLGWGGRKRSTVAGVLYWRKWGKAEEEKLMKGGFGGGKAAALDKEERVAGYEVGRSG